MNDIDVTNQVQFSNNDDECLPITRCVCGQTFEPWKFTISIYRDGAYACLVCGRKLYFSFSIRIFEVIEASE